MIHACSTNSGLQHFAPQNVLEDNVMNSIFSDVLARSISDMHFTDFMHVY